MCMEDNADVKCNFHFDKNKKGKKKGNSSASICVQWELLYLFKTKNESKWFSIPYWYKYEIVFRKIKCFHKLFTGVYEDTRVWL